MKSLSGLEATSIQIEEHLQNTCATDRWVNVRQSFTFCVHSDLLDTQPLGIYSVDVVISVSGVVVSSSVVVAVVVVVPL